MSIFDDENKKRDAYEVEAEDTAEGKSAEGDTEQGGTEERPAGEPRYAFDPPPSGETPEEEAERLAHLARSRTTLASVALIFAILAFCCCGLPFSIASLVMIIVDLRRRRVYDGLTITTLVLAIVGVIMSIVSTVYTAIIWQTVMEILESGELPAVTTGPAVTTAPPVTTAAPTISLLP